MRDNGGIESKGVFRISGDNTIIGLVKNRQRTSNKDHREYIEIGIDSSIETHADYSDDEYLMDNFKPDGVESQTKDKEVSDIDIKAMLVSPGGWGVVGH